MILLIPCLALIGVLSGFFLAKLSRPHARRALSWVILIAITAAAHLVMMEDPPLVRMTGLCFVLLGGMKGLVYTEWSCRQNLTLGRYMIFSFLWLGMDPASFVSRRTGLSWRLDLVWGAVFVAVGTMGAYVVWSMGWRSIFVMFLPMSLAFHFGVLRMAKGFLRAMGFAVRTLFPNPLETQGIGDFWSKRWNVGYSQMLQRVIGRPIEEMCGKSGASFAIFVASGFLHEVAITLPCRAGYGLPTLYFIIQGLVVVLEKSWRKPIGKIPALCCVILPLPWLFPQSFQDDVIVPCLELFF